MYCVRNGDRSHLCVASLHGWLSSKFSFILTNLLMPGKFFGNLYYFLYFRGKKVFVYEPSFGKSQLLNVPVLANQNKNKKAGNFKTKTKMVEMKSFFFIRW